MIATAMLMLAQAAAYNLSEPNPPKSSIHRLRGAELSKVITGAQVGYAIPGHPEMEVFFEDGKYELWRRWTDRGSWSIKEDRICAAAPQESCKELWRDSRGRYYYVGDWDALKRPWRINLIQNAKLPAR
ncbi:hypothetical protein [Sphingomonas hankookensis]